jgi:hypothetical protein
MLSENYFTEASGVIISQIVGTRLFKIKTRAASAVAQAVSRPLATAVALLRSQVKSSEIHGRQSGTVSFLLELQFPCQVPI